MLASDKHNLESHITS